MKEYYAFTWPGKREAIHEAGKAPTGSLRPCVELSKNFETTQNLYIEGDNLEVLKLLQKSYMRKVKMIYIDPPYNTGHDFIYKDSFIQEIDEAADDYGLFNDDGEMNFSHEHYRENTKSNPRYHSDWCSMIYPRLKVAHNLLREDGVIFISIDDNEMVNLRKICDEIFGESNFVAMFPWQVRQSIQNDTDISCNHEYVVAYAKTRRQDNRRLKESNAQTWYNTQSFACLPMPLDPSKFSNPDNDPRGIWKADPMDAPNIRPNLTYEITNPNTGEKFLPPQGRCWRVNEKTYREWLADGRIIFGQTGKSRPQLKVFYEEKKEFGSVDNTWWSAERCGTATGATKEQAQLFGTASPFDTPKPVKLIMQMLKLSSRPGADDIILDFFSGSSTTAHAVMQLNSEDSGTRKFIMVQLPEDCQPQSEAYRAGYKTICDIGRERIRRAGESLSGDTGFRVLKLDSNNFYDVYVTPDELTQDMLDNMVDNIKPDRSGLDLLFGFAAACGLPLSLKYECRELEGLPVHVYGDGEIVACFEPCVPQSVVIAMAKTLPVRGLFRDSCFASSQDKLNALQLFDGYAPDAVVTVL